MSLCHWWQKDFHRNTSPRFLHAPFSCLESTDLADLSKNVLPAAVRAQQLWPSFSPLVCRSLSVKPQCWCFLQLESASCWPCATHDLYTNARSIYCIFIRRACHVNAGPFQSWISAQCCSEAHLGEFVTFDCKRLDLLTRADGECWPGTVWRWRDTKKHHPRCRRASSGDGLMGEELQIETTSWGLFWLEILLHFLQQRRATQRALLWFMNFNKKPIWQTFTAYFC